MRQPVSRTLAARRERNARMPAHAHGTANGHEYWGCELPCCMWAVRRRRMRYPSAYRPSRLRGNR